MTTKKRFNIEVYRLLRSRTFDDLAACGLLEEFTLRVDCFLSGTLSNGDFYHAELF